VNKESTVIEAGRMVHHSTYLDVPRHWLGERFIEKAELLKIKDPLKHQHEYMGEAVGRAEQIVFYGKWEEKDFITPSLDRMYQNRFFFGGDWGFANDPATLVRCFILIENGKMNLYVDYAEGGAGIEIDDLDAKLYQKVPGAKKWKIYADSALKPSAT